MKCGKIVSGILAVLMPLLYAVPANAAEDRVHLYAGEASADAWTCPLTIPVPDRSIYCEGNTIAVQCDSDAAPYFVLTSNGGGASWAQVQPETGIIIPTMPWRMHSARIFPCSTTYP